ncbi:hypothetical protein KKF55_00420 [Patescibacteria group bacterium]|nr:hypothetical protein [Patescibacteria group bacterium]
MEFKHTQKQCIKQILRALRKRGIPLLLVGAFAMSVTGEAQAVSSWNPTLLVNTESFSAIDDGDGTTDIELRFGTTIDERLKWNFNANRFEFTRDLRVAGNLTATGSIAASGSLAVDANLTINADNGGADAVITFGNDSGAETITFNDGTNEFDISDDVNVTGTLDTTGNITTDANLTINEDNGDADAVLTFGNDAGAKALTYSNANTRFEFADDVHITGTLETTSNLTVGGTITLNGVTYTFPPSDGVSSGKVLKTDSAGTLSWATDTDTQLTEEQVTDYIGGMVTGNTETLISVTFEDGDNTLDFVVDEASIDHNSLTNTHNLTTDIDHDALTNFVANEHISWVVGDGASANLETTGSISGATIHAQDLLTSSGVLSVEGAARFGSTIELNGVTYTFPPSDGVSSGKVLATDGAGNLVWATDMNDAGVGITQVSGDNRYVNTVGDTMTGDLIIEGANLIASGATITANLAASGTLSVEGASSLQGAITAGSTIDAVGNITTDANLTINEDNGDVDAVLTFGNDAGAKALTYSNANTRFEFGDDIQTSGNISGSTLTIDGDVTLHGVTYTAPTVDGTNGQALTTDGAGTLTWADSGGGTGSGGVVAMSPEYPNAVYFNSGAVTNYIGQLAYDYDETNNENFYRWISSKAVLQEYWISARIRIPDNFSQWDATRPIQFRYRTGTANAADNFLTMRLYDTAGTQVALTSGSDLNNTSWTTATVTGPESSGTFTSGSYITVAIKLIATSAGSADAGFINLNFETTAP